MTRRARNRNRRTPAFLTKTKSATARLFGSVKRYVPRPSLSAGLAWGAVSILIACSGASAVEAADYPEHEIRLVLGFPAGSGADVTTRYIAEKLRPLSNRPVIVENRPGAAGNLAHAYVATSRPDGYTVYLVGGTSLASSVYLFKNPPIDPLRDLEPVGTVLKSPWVMIVDARSPFTTLAPLTAYLKDKGGKASYAAATTTGLVMGELYKSAADLQIVQVLYKVTGDAMNEMLNGTIDVMFANPSFTIGQTQNGKVRALAVSTASRSKAMPSVPTMAEGGVPGIDLTVWWGIMVPAHTPQPVKEKLQTWFDQILRMPETGKFFAGQGADVFISTPEETTAYLRQEIKNWGEYVRRANIEPQ
jgi:tripartite-type tricarboxylate transporter receptor subunit TctC